MKELAIGEEIRIRCVEDNHNSYGRCKGCIFSTEDDCSVSTPCAASHRTDGKNVHFELAED